MYSCLVNLLGKLIFLVDEVGMLAKFFYCLGTFTPRNKVLFNDMLGSTLGVKDGSKMTQVAMTSFGETSNTDAFFTGKPMIGELGYAFLFRNYRADNGKWQTADSLRGVASYAGIAVG